MNRVLQTGRWIPAVAVVVLAAAALLSACGRGQCQVCHRPLHGRTAYRVHLQDGATEEVCCPRCGLRFQKTSGGVRSVEVADFGTGKMMDARDAYFVEGSSVHPCTSGDAVKHDRTGAQYTLDWDRCLPSLIAFRTLDAAEAFRAEKGGKIRSYPQLLEEP
jgi:hypothetical protein